MVLMYLGLQNGPFIPHNLISVQRSPVTLLKFQMASRLKLLLSLDPRKRSPDIHVRVKPKLRTHTESGWRFHPLLHTYYITDYWLDPLSEDVFSGYYVQ